MDIKICGLCRPEDAALAASAGATHAGVVLAPGGPRSRSAGQALEILDAAAGLRRVGVFVDADLDEVCRAADTLALDVVQLHGAEAPGWIGRLREAGPWRVWKALRPRDRREFESGLDRYAALVDAVLLDGWSERAAGGTGRRFPWRAVAAARNRVPPGLRLIAAGGLTPDNVSSAIARLAPDGVDVSSGVEQGPGRKSPDRVRAFVDAARRAAAAHVDADRVVKDG